MSRHLAAAFIAIALCALGSAQISKSAGFKVNYIDGDNVYIDVGKDSDIAIGTVLVIRRSAAFSAQSGDGQVKAKIIIAKLAVVSVSNTSAMCLVRAKNSEIQLGDIATLIPGPARQPESAQAAVTTPSVNQRIPANVPGPLLNSPWIESTQTSQVIASPSAPKSLPEQMAENAKSQHPSAPSDENAPKSLPERTAANRWKERQAESQTIANSSTQPSTAASQLPTQQSPIGNNVPAQPPSPTVTSAVKASAPAQTATPAQGATVLITDGSAGTGAIPQSTPPKVADLSVSDKPAQHPAVVSIANASATLNPVPDRSSSAIPATQAKATAIEPPVASATTSPGKIEVQAKTAKSMSKVESPGQSTVAASYPVQVLPPNNTQATAPGKTIFNVKYVAEDAVYIDAGKDAGLVQGMTLTIKKADAVIGELTVASVSNTSAVCEIKSKNADIQRGDLALLSSMDQEKLVQAQTMGPNRKYPQVVAFSEGDPLDEEVRESVPKPPLPEINRARGRIGVDYTLIRTTGTASTNSYQVGGVARVDMSRIGGTYWNLNGYWRGRLNALSSSSQPQSVFDLVNRTYTIGFTYANPGSRWVAGFGRLYLPWAPSLDTNDGGYVGRRLGSHATLGIFAGTAPDPTSFNYDPNRRTAGTFIALEGGSFEGLRLTSTEGIAVSAIQWREDRQFLFSENGLFFKRFISIYHSAQADKQRLPTGGTTEGLARSFATLRVQPFTRFSIDVNHNYFRDVPTFDPALVGTGLLDKFLFQGVSLGSRLELPGRISLYNNFGQSSKSGDAHNSFNQLYGVTVARLWKTGLRGDVRYSKFNSSFGQGNYRAASLSRSFSEMVRIEVTAGQQRFISLLAVPTDYKLLGSTIDMNLGGHYFVESGVNLQRGLQQNFDQWLFTMGYRFDTRSPR